MAGFVLPEAPESLRSKAVRAWSAPVVIPTYEPMPADKNPMFLEKRVYQGSSGKVYPLPFIDRISTEKKDRAWQAIHIENEYVRLMILPELGGRIHVGLDKTNGYDFFYRQNVIKPALVGLAGPWISGGVEFNWPQHHRPSTFMPIDTHIEEHGDGSVTVWCSEHEPMNRMKGMHGVHLKPGSSLIELKVRLYNRTELPQTFLWWANVAARVHEQYQSFFPPDVQYVADHAKRAMSRFPLCEGKYYGVDYGENSEFRSQNAEWKDGAKAAFVPGDYARNDLSWYANIPVPTSYMILGTKEDFFGGYDHFAEAGFVHVADHRIAPGKKQWTWGNHPFGYAWDRNLTDPEDPTDASPPYRRNLPAPYIELMAGVFTDNQPDFSYLMPGETRSFSQYWYPIQKIGVVQKANERAALSLTTTKHEDAKDTKTHEEFKKSWILRIGVVVTSKIAGARVIVRRGEAVVFEKGGVMLMPGAAMVEEVGIGEDVKMTELRAVVFDEGGREVIAYQPVAVEKKEVPAAAREPGLPEEIGSVEELYLVGLHLEQYRHATRKPEAYWREALKREPGDARCNNALGLWHLRRGEFGKAVGCFEKAIETLTKWNPNPRDGEVFYNLGVALRYLNRLEEAYEAFGKATWNEAWQGAAYFAMAQMDCLNRNWPKSMELLNRTLAANAEHIQARNLKVLVLRRAQFKSEAEDLLDETLRKYPLDFMAKFLNSDDVPCGRWIRLDLAMECFKAGFYGEAADVFDDREWDRQSDAAMNALAEPTYMHSVSSAGSAGPLVGYHLGYFAEREGHKEEAMAARKAAALAPPDYCFPHRLEEVAILLDAIEKNPEDARAPYYLGNLLYDKGRHEEAITWWEKAAKLDRSFPTVWRNLGIGYYNILHDPVAAKGAYQRALQNSLTWGVNTDKETRRHGDTEQVAGDARVLYERDRLWKRTKEAPEKRVAELEEYPELVRQRDDLTVEYCTLLNQLGRHEEALAILRERHFQPWEGGEGMVLGQWARTHSALGRKKLWLSPADGGSPAAALVHFEAALHPPENLGEAWHLLQNNSELHYWAGMAEQAAERATSASGTSTTHAQRPFGPTGRSEGSNAPLSMAHAHFETAAASVGDFQGMAVKAYSEATYWAGLALQELGRHGEARGLFEAMLEYAGGLKKSTAKIDYFATSLPTMLLFEDDIQAVQNRQATLIEALARHGLNGGQGADRKAARRLLNDLLAENPSDGAVADLMIALDWGAG